MLARFTSRKFLALVGTALGALALILAGDASAAQIGAFAIAVIGAVGYMVSEASVDAAREAAAGQASAAAALATAPATAAAAATAATATAAGVSDARAGV